MKDENEKIGMSYKHGGVLAGFQEELTGPIIHHAGVQVGRKPGSKASLNCLSKDLFGSFLEAFR